MFFYLTNLTLSYDEDLTNEFDAICYAFIVVWKRKRVKVGVYLQEREKERERKRVFFALCLVPDGQTVSGSERENIACVYVVFYLARTKAGEVVF